VVLCHHCLEHSLKLQPYWPCLTTGSDSRTVSVGPHSPFHSRAWCTSSHYLFDRMRRCIRSIHPFRTWGCFYRRWTLLSWMSILACMNQSWMFWSNGSGRLRIWLCSRLRLPRLKGCPGLYCDGVEVGKILWYYLLDLVVCLNNLFLLSFLQHNLR